MSNLISFLLYVSCRTHTIPHLSGNRLSYCKGIGESININPNPMNEKGVNKFTVCVCLCAVCSAMKDEKWWKIRNWVAYKGPSPRTLYLLGLSGVTRVGVRWGFEPCLLTKKKKRKNFPFFISVKGYDCAWELCLGLCLEK